MPFFLPKTTDFITLLVDITKGIQKLSDLYTKFANEFSNFEYYQTKAAEFENEGDKSVHLIINELHKTFITPFDREDIYALAHNLDHIMDKTEEIIQNVNMYNVSVKKPFFDQFTPLVAEATTALIAAVGSLYKLKAETVSPYLLALHEVEDKADIVYKNAMSDLFRNEKDPIVLIQWKNLYEDLEDLMDQYQEVSNIIEGIVVKNA